VIRAVKKLKVLGHGFELHTLGGDRFLVQSVPGELSLDDTRVLQLAEETGGYVSRELICDQLRWDGQRANRVLERLVKGEMAWLDGQSADATIQYWFPSLFLEQQFSIGGGGNNNNNNVLGMGGAGSESASMLSASVSLK
jgi:ESCRT-II complex subunit VPS22